MKKNFWKIFLLLLIFIIGCDKNNCRPSKSHYDIEIINQTKFPIHYYFSWNFPDTTLSKYALTTEIIESEESLNAPITGKRPKKDCLEKIFEEYPSAWLFIFHADSVSTIPWEEIRQTHRGILTREVITLEYLENNNFSVTIN